MTALGDACLSPRGIARRRIREVWPACRAALLLLALTGGSGGCAVYQTYEKCGLHGCPGDEKITADIRLQFSRQRFLEPNAIRVQTLDRVVFLDGVVSSGLEIDAAETIARGVPGVERVVNSIVVSTAR